jgi:hypothetical protein
MKKLFFLLLLSGVIVSVQAQKINAKDVPAPITDTFNKTHMSPNDVNWLKDGKYYRVEYTVNKLDNAITYDMNGALIVTREGIPVLNLPKCVGDYVRIQYPHNNIKKAFKNTDEHMVITYEAEVNDKHLHFDMSCNLMTP